MTTSSNSVHLQVPRCGYGRSLTPPVLLLWIETTPPASPLLHLIHLRQVVGIRAVRCAIAHLIGSDRVVGFDETPD